MWPVIVGIGIAAIAAYEYMKPAVPTAPPGTPPATPPTPVAPGVPAPAAAPPPIVMFSRLRLSPGSITGSMNTVQSMKVGDVVDIDGAPASPTNPAGFILVTTPPGVLQPNPVNGGSSFKSIGPGIAHVQFSDGSTATLTFG